MYANLNHNKAYLYDMTVSYDIFQVNCLVLPVRQTKSVHSVLYVLAVCVLVLWIITRMEHTVYPVGH